MSFVIRRHYRLIVIKWLTFFLHLPLLYMVNAIIRRYLRLPELWRAVAVGMVQQGVTFSQVGAALGVHLTGAWYQLNSTPARRHAGGWQMVTRQALCRFLVVQASRARFSTATSLRNDLANAAGVRVSTQTVRIEGCKKVICGPKFLHTFH
jgi:hypothetical protein